MIDWCCWWSILLLSQQDDDDVWEPSLLFTDWLELPVLLFPLRIVDVDVWIDNLPPPFDDVDDDDDDCSDEINDIESENAESLSGESVRNTIWLGIIDDDDGCCCCCWIVKTKFDESWFWWWLFSVVFLEIHKNKIYKGKS